MKFVFTLITLLVLSLAMPVEDDDPKSYCNLRKRSYWTIFKDISGCQDTSSALRARHRLTPKQGQLLMDYLSSGYSDRKTWEKRRADIRKYLRQNMGLANVAGQFDGGMILTDIRKYDGYNVCNFALEILSGIYCTGSVYWPEKSEGDLPLILNPHGHYEGGRCHPIVQTRCAAFALMGCVSVCYDMFAYGPDSQFDEKYHKTALAQPYNILCAERLLDYFLEDDRIDRSRVGITGSSGGGTQSFLVTALDNRITLSMPVVMVSSTSFGGCPCESGTAVHFSGEITNNVELASLCAPRPMLLVSDGADWTKDFHSIDFPYIKRIYGFYGAEDKLSSVYFADEVHDYGPSKRKVAYEFLAEHWRLDTSLVISSDGAVDESKCIVEPENSLKIWGSEGIAMPEGIVRSAADFAGILGWKPRLLDVSSSR